MMMMMKLEVKVMLECRTKYVYEDAKFNVNDEVNAVYKDGDSSKYYEATIINIKKTNDLGYMYHVVAKDRSKWWVEETEIKRII